jgi:enamine deaminase RidA (YjgF/YER057c/UK114 family)
MLPIKRWRGQAQGRNRAAAYHGLLWTVATHEDPAADIREQTRRCLARLDESLAEAGTDKTRLVSAQVFLADMSTKPAFDVVWNEWIGPDPDTWPQRACVGAVLAGHCRVEIILVAAVA